MQDKILSQNNWTIWCQPTFFICRCCSINQSYKYVIYKRLMEENFTRNIVVQQCSTKNDSFCGFFFIPRHVQFVGFAEYKHHPSLLHGLLTSWWDGVNTTVRNEINIVHFIENGVWGFVFYLHTLNIVMHVKGILKISPKIIIHHTPANFQG